MFEIINKQVLTNQVKRIDITAPDIALKALPGQFVKIIPREGDEGVPLSIADSNLKKGTISLIFREEGYTTSKLGELAINEPIYSILGPLGTPSTIEKKKTVIFIATGVGVAQILSICRAYRQAECKIIGIIGAKTKRSLVLETQMRLACHKIFVATEDGSYERRGVATDLLDDYLAANKADLVYAIGSNEMMQSVCQITKLRGVKTYVHLNPVMVDCVGMCGSCRVKVGKKTVLACIEGPEFDGHSVDFEDLNKRMKAYQENKTCCKQASPLSQQRSEQNRLAKFLSAILGK